MRARGKGRIMITGSEAGFVPGTFHAVYNGTKAFIDSFSFALRAELKNSGVTVTCLMPGPTETEFFERADLMDTKVGQSSKDDPADVASAGFEAMMRGNGDVVAGWKTKLQTSMAAVTPAGWLAEVHRKKAAPGYRKSAGPGLAVPATVAGATALLALGWIVARQSDGRHRTSGRAPASARTVRPSNLQRLGRRSLLTRAPASDPEPPGSSSPPRDNPRRRGGSPPSSPAPYRTRRTRRSLRLPQSSRCGAWASCIRST
jgi:short chain dehydrogenase